MEPLYGFYSPEKPVNRVCFLRDITTLSAQKNTVDQQIFAHALGMINSANDFIYLDFFLLNDFQRQRSSASHPISSKLIQALIEKKVSSPKTEIIVACDPINTVYGGYENHLITKLENHEIKVVFTNLDALRDSNPAYSFLWQLFCKFLGNAKRAHLPNPLGEGKVSLRSYLRMFNFKANHRKILVTTTADGAEGLVTSANPHDASGAHHNIAISFVGEAAADLLQSEVGMLERSSRDPNVIKQVKHAISAIQKSLQKQSDCKVISTHSSPYPARSASSPIEPLLTGPEILLGIACEQSLRNSLLSEIRQAKNGDEVLIAMFYLSHRTVIKALKSAHDRGCKVSIILDPNKDAFGHKKSGIPNRPVAAELKRHGIEVRWCNTHGEQFHSKLCLIHSSSGKCTLFAGSANLTRRNLDNYNLETDIVIQAPFHAAPCQSAYNYFYQLWANQNEQHTLPYSHYADERTVKRWQYLFLEKTGLGTF